LTEALDFVKTDLMPDFDFDAFNHDDAEEGAYAQNSTPVTPIAQASTVVEEVPDIDPETITEKKPLEARDTPASAGDNLSGEEVDKW